MGHCESKESAKKLPPRFWKCDGLSSKGSMCPRADQKSCDADTGCTWCIPQGLIAPAHCETQESARKLLPAKWRCDGLALKDSICPHADQASCDADKGCTWCIPQGLIAPAHCETEESAKKLLPAKWRCDGLGVIQPMNE